MLAQKVRLNQMLIATNSEKIDISLEVKTAEVAKKFSQILKKGDVVFLYGEIGVGKTTFSSLLINGLEKDYNLQQSEVPSPTFNIVFEYEINNMVIKPYDLYRIQKKEDIINLGIFAKWTSFKIQCGISLGLNPGLIATMTLASFKISLGFFQFLRSIKLSLPIK